MKTNTTRWGALWYSKNILDGITKHLMYEYGIPRIFLTREDARKWIKKNYGYILRRPDLRIEPHGWTLPKAVKIKVVIEAIK